MSAPTQPNLPLYPATNLELFPRLTRSPGDPPFVAGRRPKDWKDPDAASQDPAQYLPYKVLHVPPGTITVVEMLVYIPAGEAATTNFHDPLPAGADTLVNFTPPASLPAWEHPVRDLLPNEQFLNTPFGIEVRRTDLDPSAATATGFTAADEALLQSINKKLDTLLAK